MVKWPRLKTDRGTDSPRRWWTGFDIKARNFAALLRNSNGFTLLELMIVLAIMGVLVSIATPNLKISIVRAREAVLREDLFQIREAIDQYYADNDKYPPTLQDLINQQEKTKSYLRDIPKDPFTGASDWITVAAEGEEGGVFDAHSASPLIAIDGTTYNSW
ncbi:MAG TPA: type II secretion system protein [Nitrospirota bacterium]|nr:type II secretion system protein [Nitrospirota bacterium]